MWLPVSTSAARCIENVAWLARSEPTRDVVRMSRVIA